MKSLLLTALLSTGLAHTGAFLEVWKLPYVEDHFTLNDLGRKLNKVTKWNETANALRERRDEAADENYALYDEAARSRDKTVEIVSSNPGSRYKPAPMKTRSRTFK